MSHLAEAIYEKVRDVVGPGKISLHEPYIGQSELDTVSDSLKSGFVSSVGEWVTRFENDLMVKTGASHAIAMSSGTGALQIALKVAGVEPGDEVLVPAMSFVATANSVSHLGAVPHFVDISPKTLGMDPGSVHAVLDSYPQTDSGGVFNSDTGRKISAIVPMHCFGHPVDLSSLHDVARQFNMPVIEDAAEGLGSFFQNNHVGTTSIAGILSFNGNKIITTGGGGALITNNNSIAEHAKHLSTTAKVSHKWEFEHDEVGHNFRMPNINAALGHAQLTRLDDYLEKKRSLAHIYQEAFAGDDRFTFLTEPYGAKSNYWLNTLILDSSHWQERDKILEYADSRELQFRPAWKLLPELKPYQSNPRAALPVAKDLNRRIINIPSSAFLAGN